MILKKIRRLIEFSSENLGKLYQESCSHDLVIFFVGLGGWWGYTQFENNIFPNQGFPVHSTRILEC